VRYYKSEKSHIPAGKRTFVSEARRREKERFLYKYGGSWQRSTIRLCVGGEERERAATLSEAGKIPKTIRSEKLLQVFQALQGEEPPGRLKHRHPKVTTKAISVRKYAQTGKEKESFFVLSAVTKKIAVE